jgi:hypothetical protein
MIGMRAKVEERPRHLWCLDPVARPQQGDELDGADKFEIPCRVDAGKFEENIYA